MSGLTKKTMAKVFNEFSILFDKSISVEKMDILWEEFKEWNEPYFIEIAEIVKKRCRFLPTIADFYEAKETMPPRRML